MARLQRRGKIWYAWVPLEGGVGTRLVSTRCTDKRAAETRAAELERRAVDPVGTNAASRTLRDALSLLLRDRTAQAESGRRSPATVEFYRKKSGALLDRLHDVLGRSRNESIFLREITPGLVDEWVLARRGDGVEESTILHEMTTLRAAMRLAQRRGWWAGDILQAFPRGTLKGSRARSRWLTFADVLALHDALVRPIPYRGRVEWPEHAQARVLALREAGATRAEIVTELQRLGVPGASPATVGRRLRELHERDVDEPAPRAHGPLIGHAHFARVAFAIATSAEWSAIGRARREDFAEDLSVVRVRGSKNSRRDRPAALELLAFRFLAAYALEHGDGTGGRLFAPCSSFRGVLARACDRAGIPRVCPTDLRRTHAKWLRLSGVAPANIAPNMGHADSRMVERIYGAASALELAAVQRGEIALRYVSGEGVDSGVLGSTRESAKPAKTPGKPVPRDGIEPPTRGFSIRGDEPISSAKVAHSAGGSTDSVEPTAAEKVAEKRRSLEVALERASAAGEWDVVRLLAEELRTRRLEEAGVVQLQPKTKGR